MDPKKTGNWTQPDRFGPDHQLQLPTLLDGWTARNQTGFNQLQPPQDIPSKYLQNASKNIKNDQNLNELLNFY